MEELVAFGSEIKAIGGGKVAGWLVKFTSPNEPDFHNDYFTPNTDYDIKNGDEATVYYNHGFDETLKRRKLGKGTMEIRDAGVWIEAQLNLRDEYEKAIYEAIRRNKMGWSSGSLGHLVERKQVGQVREITAWPLGKDASITPTPAAGMVLTSVVPLKSWESQCPALKSVLSEVEELGSSTTGTEKPQETTASNFSVVSQFQAKDFIIMADERTPQQEYADQLAALKGLQAKIGDYDTKFETLNDSIEKMLKYVEGMPAKDRAGWVTDDGGNKEPAAKSFADFLIAVRRRDSKRLNDVYKSRYEYDDTPAAKDLMVDSGEGGGYLVPQEYEPSLLQLSMDSSPIVSKVQTINIARTSGSWPSLDQFTAPTAGIGDTAMAAGVVATATAEGGALTETEPGFKMLNWRLHKVGGYTQVTNELLSDSPMAIEALLRSLFAVAIAAKTEYLILRGSGAGEPLGILNSPAIVNVTPATNNLFSWPDVGTMQSRFKKVGTAAANWLIHPSVWPDILTMEVGTAGGSVWAANMQAAAGNTINGYGIIQSEHLPQANNSGNVILADLYAYLLFQKAGGLSIAFSEHVGFLNDLGTWRFNRRLDGKPWLRSAITLADPQGSYTVSPFVVHND